MLKLKTHILTLVAALCVGGLISVHLGQDLNYDLLNYHYYSPHALLEGRFDYDINAGQHQTFQNPLIDVPAYLLIAHFSPVVAGALLGALHGIAIWLVFEIALILLSYFKLGRRLQMGLSASIALVSITGAATLSEIGGTMGDNLSGLFVLLGLWLLLLSLREKVSKKQETYFRLAAYFSVGLALGLKLTNLMFGAGILAAGLLFGKTWRQKLVATVQNGLSMAAGLLVTGGLWMLYLWRTVGNPIFPFYNEIFKSPYYPAINFLDARWFPRGEKQLFFYPYYFIKEQALAVEIPFKDPRLAVLYSALIITGIYLVVRKLCFKKPIFNTWDKPIWAFWICIITSYILWQKQFSNYRYLIVIELLSLVGIAIVCFTLFKNRLAATALVIASLVLIPLGTKQINWGRVPWQPEYFGPNLQSQLAIPGNSTVLIAGGNPFGYLAPYLPEGVRVIRIDSNMLSPTAREPLAEFNKVRQAIKDEERQQDQFYALVTTDETARWTVALDVFEYKTTSCRPITTYSNDYVFKGMMQVMLCRLTGTSTTE